MNRAGGEQLGISIQHRGQARNIDIFAESIPVTLASRARKSNKPTFIGLHSAYRLAALAPIGQLQCGNSHIKTLLYRYNDEVDV